MTGPSRGHPAAPQMEQKDAQTICAVATPAGLGGISVIRVSGSRAVEITRRLASFLPAAPTSHTVYYGFLERIDRSEKIDEVLLTYFAAGKSFTGEETIEISCHGSPIICHEIVKELTLVGCRIAEKGEFTYRAFMNGRVDLVQAESVQTLVASQTNEERKNSLRQLAGGLSEEIASIEKKLTRLLSHIEADIDFSQENLATMSDDEAGSEISEIQKSVNRLVESYRAGRVLREGFKALLLGPTNVGKSSLLNLVLGEERAIVTDIAGTTRDLVEGWTDIKGVRTSWIDSAGLRETQERVESIGIDKTLKASQKADLIFWVCDISKDIPASDVALIADLVNQKRDVVVLANKKDLVPDLSARLKKLSDMIKSVGVREIFAVSSLVMGDRAVLTKAVEARIDQFGGSNSVVVSQARHFEALTRAQISLDEAKRIHSEKASPEILALALKESLIKVQEILGIRYDEQVIDQIFKEFCLGK